MPKSTENNFAARLVRRLGQNSCLIDGLTGQLFTREELPALVVGYAQGLISAGLQAGDRILINCLLSVPSALAYLGAMYAGLVPVPVEERLLANYGDVLLAKARVKALWSSERTRWGQAKGNGITEISGSFPPVDVESLSPTKCEEHDTAALMPTSGSTNVPRLVMVSHGNLTANTEAIIRSQRLGTDERAMLVMPISYCFGASILHSHLYQGGGVVFDSRFMFPDKVLRAINTHECTTFAGVPVVYNILLRRSNLRSIALPTLRRFLQAGGALATECIREMRTLVPSAEFIVMYGQTEATARISLLPSARLEDKLGSAGVPLDNIEVRIVDELGREASSGTAGEIQVRGPSVCSGYFEDPESTKSKFSNGWLKTGDFGFRDEEGYLWIKGRADEFIKIRGRRVSIAEVEAKIGAVPGVCECAAAGVQHAEAGEALALFVVPENMADGLPERVTHALPPEWTCAYVKLVAELPRTANGKVARSELRSLL